MNLRRMLELLPRSAMIVLAGLAIYTPIYRGDWLWDDDIVLTRHPDVQSGTLRGLLKLWTDPAGLDYFPLSSTAFWLQAIFFGNQPVGYHITSVLLHITSGLLLWTLLAKMRIPGAWASGLLFTIHPACVESVAWIAEIKNTLSLPLFLASCISWVGQDDQRSGPPRERRYLLSLALFLLALLAKTSVVAMPVLTLLYAWWKRGTVTMQDVLRAAPMFLISIVLGIVTIQYQWGRAIGVEDLHVGGLDSRMATAGMAILFYIATIVWPVHLLPIYPRWEVDPPKAWQFLPWILICGAAWWMWKNRKTTWGRNAILAFGFFLLMIAPVLGFVNISYMRITWVADHFLYLPMIGPLALIVAAATTGLETRHERERTFLTATAAGVILLLATNAFFYSFNWVNEDHLWEHTLASNHDAWMAHNRLGVKKLDRGDLEEALSHFRHAVRVRPDLAETLNNLAVALARKGNVDEALPIYERAAALSQDLNIRVDLADYYLLLGRYQDARTHYEKLLTIVPENPFILQKNALALFHLGEKEKAIAGFRRVLEIDPAFKEARESLKVALGAADAKPAPPPRAND